MLQRNSLKSAILVIFLSGSGLQAQTSKGTDLWGPFQFLIGNWSGVGSGNPADAIAGSTSFSFDLDKCIILRRNRAEYPPIAGEKINKVHEDLMIIYPDSADSKFHAVYFDNEGHFINYIVSISANQPALEFVSVSHKEGPRFRLVYESRLEGTLTTEFFIAPPGGDYKLYVRGTLKKNQ